MTPGPHVGSPRIPVSVCDMLEQQYSYVLAKEMHKHIQASEIFFRNPLIHLPSHPCSVSATFPNRMLASFPAAWLEKHPGHRSIDYILRKKKNPPKILKPK